MAAPNNEAPTLDEIKSRLAKLKADRDILELVGLVLDAHSKLVESHLSASERFTKRIKELDKRVTDLGALLGVVVVLAAVLIITLWRYLV